MFQGKRDLEKEKLWREIIARWRDSGLSKSQFCYRENLKLNTFCNWISVIAERDTEQLREAGSKRRAKQKAQRRNRAAGKGTSADFVQAKCSVQANSSPLEAVANRIEISTPDGLVIRLPGNSNSALLFAVLQALR